MKNYEMKNMKAVEELVKPVEIVTALNAYIKDHPYVDDEGLTIEDLMDDEDIDVPEDNLDYLSTDMMVERVYGNSGMWTILNPWSHEILNPSKTYATGSLEYFSKYVYMTDCERNKMLKEAADMCEDVEYRIDIEADALEY